MSSVVAGTVERPLHLGAGGVAAGVDDASPRVSALAGERPLPPVAASSKRAPSLTNSVTAAIAVGDDRASPRRDRTGPAPAARVSATCAVDRVVGVAAAPRRSRPGRSAWPSRPASAGLAQHDHAAAARCAASAAARPADPGADDDDVGAAACPGRAVGCGHSPPPRLADLDHPLHAGARPSRRSRDRRATSSAPSTRQRNSAAGVIIFMYLHDARSLTARKSTSGAALRNWCSIPTSVATSTCRASGFARGVEHAAGGQDLDPVLGERALTGQVQRRGGAAAFGMHDTARRRDACGPARSARRR